MVTLGLSRHVNRRVSGTVKLHASVSKSASQNQRARLKPIVK